MVRVSNRYWNFAYRDVKRCDAGIERGLSNNATRTPKDETYDAGCEDNYAYYDYQISWMSKSDGWIDESKKSDKEESEGHGVKGHLTNSELGPKDANQHKQRRSEKRSLTQCPYP